MKLADRLLRSTGLAFALTFIAALVVLRVQEARDADRTVTLDPVPVEKADPAPVQPTSLWSSLSGPGWFEKVKPYCNPVEVAEYLARHPAPQNLEGTAHEAACRALAGDVFTARDLIRTLDRDERWRAANVIFTIAHPIADAGDEVAAGPVMEMVVEFWPNNYMALYHAGAARFEAPTSTDNAEAAAHYLERFLEHYSADDGWTRSAKRMLEELAAR